MNTRRSAYEDVLERSPSMIQQERRSIWASAALLATLAGCSDTHNANEANFRKAAQAYLDTQYPHCFVVTDFPTKTQDFDVTGTNKALHALAGVGIVSEKEIARVEVPERLWQPARTDIYYECDP